MCTVKSDQKFLYFFSFLKITSVSSTHLKYTLGLDIAENGLSNKDVRQNGAEW